MAHRLDPEYDDPYEVCDVLLRHYADRLDSWSENFVRDVRARFNADRHYHLSSKQRNKLTEIFERATRGGSDAGYGARI